MEMYQVRYFLSVARVLNFTRAAEDCEVAQPSLSRAIKHLEAELGGELFRRERPQAILTELGHRMLPILNSMLRERQGGASARRGNRERRGRRAARRAVADDRPRACSLLAPGDEPALRWARARRAA